MGTASKIIGVEPSAISKIDGVAIASAAKIGGQTIESFSNTCCLDFDGSNDYLNVPYDASLNLTGATDVFTISFWVKFLDIANSGWKTLCGMGFHAANQGWSLDMYGANPPTQIQFQKPNQGTYVNADITSGGAVGALVNNVWYHILIRSDNNLGPWGEATFFINGTDMTGSAMMGMAPITSSTPFVIGAGPSTCCCWSDCIGGFINARIDEFSFWDKYLSDLEVAAMYNSGTPTDLTGSSNLVSWWRMGEGATFPTIPDEVGSNTGTMTNMVAGDIDCTDAA